LVEELSDEYAHRQYPNEFDYMRFCADMEAIETFHPTSSLPRPLNATSKAFAAPTSSTAHLLSRFRAALLRTRGNIDEFFKIHDKSNNGRCSPSKFATALTCVGFDVSKAELELLCAEFRVNDTDIDYRSFLDIVARSDDNKYSSTIDEVTASADALAGSLSRTSTLPPRSVFDAPVRRLDDAPAVRAKLQHLLRAARVQIEPATNCFQVHDPLRRGVLPVPVFLGTLDASYRLGLAPAELQAVADFYTLEPAEGAKSARDLVVDYRAFVLDMAAGEGADAGWSPHVENEADAEAEVADEARVVVAQLAAVTQPARLELLPHFADRDPFRRGCVNARQFRTVLSVVPLPLPERCYEALAARYQKGALGVDYRRFVADLLAAEDEVLREHQRRQAAREEAEY
jgi:Ca2+-binding EF-hand superfamily protein